MFSAVWFRHVSRDNAQKVWSRFIVCFRNFSLLLKMRDAFCDFLSSVILVLLELDSSLIRDVSFGKRPTEESKRANTHKTSVFSFHEVHEIQMKE
jgi:hypothetical protein